MTGSRGLEPLPVPTGPIHEAPSGFMTDQVQAELLFGVLRAADVILGPYDVRIAGWVASWDASTVLPIARWVQDAYAAGYAAGAAVDGAS